MIIIRSSILLLLFVTISACTYSLNFNPKSDKRLKKSHQYSEKTEHVVFYYDVVKKGENSDVSIALKNKSKFFMSNFTIKYSAAGQSRFVSLGSIKNNNSKEFVITVPCDTTELRLDYEYYLSREDQFMQGDAYGGAGEQYFGVHEEFKKVDRKVLYLK